MAEITYVFDNSLADAIAGALAVSAWADALGAAHELSGLKGEVGVVRGHDAPSAEELIGRKSDPWGVWPPVEDRDQLYGIVTDDTSVRVTLIEPWLATQEAGALADESNFEKWLTQSGNSAGNNEYWRIDKERFHKDKWPVMFQVADGRMTDPETIKSLDFYARGIPLAFGVFLYHELMLLYAEHSPLEVFSKFMNFCRLDHAPACGITGVTAVLTADVTASGIGTVSTWSDVAVDEAIDLWRQTEPDLTSKGWGDELSHPGEILRNAYHLLGRQRRGSSPHDFLVAMKDDLYANSPDHVPSKGLKPYDALLQLSQALACIGFAGDDWPLAIRCAAAIAGDADTVGTHVGIFIGARVGLKQVFEHHLAGSAVKTVAETTEKLYGVSLAERVLRLQNYRPPHLRYLT